MNTLLICAEVIAGLRQLPDESVHCVITSPPYWGLRDYGVEGQIGLEKTPAEYLDKMVAVFREVRRVLRSDGTLWMNMGDSFITSPRLKELGLKSKDLAGMPWRLALAMQTDGWWLRSDIIWQKKTPMPESVLDRPTRSHEYVFLLSKSARYFYDTVAVMEPASGNAHSRGNGLNPKACGKNSRIHRDIDPDHQAKAKIRAKQNRSFSAAVASVVAVRNLRSVWTLAAQPYKGAHFATYPESLVRPCILAGTSEMGCCSSCGAPVKRIVDRAFVGDWHPDRSLKVLGISRGSRDYQHKAREGAIVAPRTTGWKPTCPCSLSSETQPCTVLDPFMGSGTTAAVAVKLGRSFVGIDINAEYAAMAEQRIDKARELRLQ